MADNSDNQETATTIGDYSDPEERDSTITPIIAAFLGNTWLHFTFLSISHNCFLLLLFHAIQFAYYSITVRHAFNVELGHGH